LFSVCLFSGHIATESSFTELADSSNASDDNALQPEPVISVSTKQPPISGAACPPGDLGVDKPAQPRLNIYPARIFV